MRMYDGKTDDELILLLRDSTFKDKDLLTDYILNKYKMRVRKKAKALFLIGGDADDLIQEGMIGLFKALQNYESGREATFQSFAELCISRQMYTAIEVSRRKKHGPLNSYISMDTPIDDEGTMTLEQLSTGALGQDPQDLYISHETMEDRINEIKIQLSAFGWEVFELQLSGITYREIAKRLEKPEKTVDNALQRIKAKVNRLYDRE